MKFLKTFNENSKSIVEEIVDFINPCDPMMSDEYSYYCWGDDEAYYDENLGVQDYLDCIKSCVFRQDSHTSKKFGWNVLQDNKDEVIKLCKEYLEADFK